MNLDQNKWVQSLKVFWDNFPPSEYQCAACKAAVDPMDERWRMGYEGWEHVCPDNHPQAGHCPSERVPVEAAES